VADLTAQRQQLSRRARLVGRWVLGSNLRLSLVMAMGSRLSLMGMAMLVQRSGVLRAAVTSEAEALQAVRLHHPGFLLCSDSLEEGSASRLLAQAHAQTPDLRSMVILTQADPSAWFQRLTPAERALPSAIVCERELADENELGVRIWMAAVLGERYRSPLVEQVLQTPSPAQAPGPMLALSPREHQVLQLLTEGLTDREIASTLGLSVETVRGYSKALLQKLGVTSRGRLLRRAMQLGLQGLGLPR